MPDFFNRLFRCTRPLAWLGCALAVAGGAAQADEAARIAAGRAIYVDGRLPDGGPLAAQRGGEKLEGRAAACVQCHRGSGLGQVEGDYAVPPITGRALFGARRSVVVNMDRTRGKAMNVSHEPYAPDEFSRLVREGRHPSGRELGGLMPRYALGEAELQSLKAYLETLSAQWSPGVDRDTIRIATVVAPGVDAQRRRAFLDTLQAAVKRKNTNTMPGKRHMVSAAEFAMKTERRWQLDVWELQGPESGWGEQLRALHRRQPVFMVLSGLSDGGWAPVQQFCEAERMPCWFPSVPLVPATATGNAWSLYFQRGVSLEAELLASHITASQPGSARAARARRVVQWVDGSPAAEEGAQVLAQRLSPQSAAVTRVLIDKAAPETLRAALRQADGADAVVLWLGSDALAALLRETPPRARVYLSGLLSGGERLALPAAWKKSTDVAYLYELPALRGQSTAYFRHWLDQAGVALTDEVMQSEVYFAVTFLADTLGDMLENLYRDYLIERAEIMLSRREGRKVEEERRDVQTLRRYATVHPLQAEGAANSREGTTVYPALSLGPGQRFASKGGYVVPHALLTGAAAVEPEWMTP